MDYRKKAAIDFTLGKLIAIVLILLIAVVLIISLVKFGLPEKIKIYFPEFFHPKDPTIDNSSLSLSCPIKIAIIDENNYITLCRDDECKKTERSNLYLTDEEISIKGYRVGSIIRGSLVLFNEILEGIGTADNPSLYYDVKNELPSYDNLTNLDFSYFFTKKDICRDSKTSESEIRKEKAIKEVEIHGKKFYFNADELLKNQHLADTILYLDKNLEQKGDSFIDKDWAVHREKEEQEEVEPIILNIVLIKKSAQNSNVYLTKELTEGGESDKIKMLDSRRIDNTDNKLGFYSNGDDFEYVKYKKKNGKVYVKFLDFDGANYETPYILMDYWNAYQSFSRVPEWALLK